MSPDHCQRPPDRSRSPPPPRSGPRPRCCWPSTVEPLLGMLALNALRRARRAGRPAAARRAGRVAPGRHDHRHIDRSRCCWPSPCSPSRCSPGWPAESASCSARRSSPGCARATWRGPVAAPVHGRAGGHRRPGHPQHRRRRGAVPHRALRGARGPGRDGHRGAHRRRGLPHRPAARPAAAGRCAADRGRHPLVPAPGAAGLPGRARVLRGVQRVARRDGRRRPHGRGAGARRRRIATIERDLARAHAAERYTLRLRTFWFPTMEIAYAIPVTLSLVWGGWLVAGGHASLARSPRSRSTPSRSSTRSTG